MSVLVLILLQVTPSAPSACSAPIVLQQGEEAPCVGGALVPISWLSAAERDLRTCEERDKATALVLARRERACTESIAVLDRLGLTVQSILEASLDRSTERIVATEPPPVPWYERPWFVASTAAAAAVLLTKAF